MHRLKATTRLGNPYSCTAAMNNLKTVSERLLFDECKYIICLEYLSIPPCITSRHLTNTIDNCTLYINCKYEGAGLHLGSNQGVYTKVYTGFVLHTVQLQVPNTNKKNKYMFKAHFLLLSMYG